MAKIYVQSLVRNVANIRGCACYQDSGVNQPAMDRADAMSLSSPRPSMPGERLALASGTRILASAGSFAVTAGETFSQRRSWPTGIHFPGRTGTLVVLKRDITRRATSNDAGKSALYGPLAGSSKA